MIEESDAYEMCPKLHNRTLLLPVKCHMLDLAESDRSKNTQIEGVARHLRKRWFVHVVAVRGVGLACTGNRSWKRISRTSPRSRYRGFSSTLNLDEFAGSSCFDFLFSNVAGTEKKRCTTKRLQSPTLTPSSAWKRTCGGCIIDIVFRVYDRGYPSCFFVIVVVVVVVVVLFVLFVFVVVVLLYYLYYL